MHSIATNQLNIMHCHNEQPEKMHRVIRSNFRRYSTLAWGEGADGKLGLGTEMASRDPQPIAELEGKTVKSLSAGAFHSVAVVADGSDAVGRIYTWGSNYYGQAGFMPQTRGMIADEMLLNPSEFTENMQSESIKAVKCGDFHSIALAESGTVFSWGAGLLGCGNEYFDSRPVELKFPDGWAVSDILAKRGLSLALITNSVLDETRLYIWGTFDDANGKRLKAKSPVGVKLPVKLPRIHAIDSDGHLIVVWGSREDGLDTLVVLGSPAVIPNDIPYSPDIQDVESVTDTVELPVVQIIKMDNTLNPVKAVYLVERAVVVVRSDGAIQVVTLFGQSVTLDNLTSIGPIDKLAVGPHILAAVTTTGNVFEWKVDIEPPKQHENQSWFSWLLSKAKKKTKDESVGTQNSVSLLEAIEEHGPSHKTTGVKLIAVGWNHSICSTK